MRDGEGKDGFGGSGEDDFPESDGIIDTSGGEHDPLEANGVIQVLDAADDQRGVPSGEMGSEFTPENTDERLRIRTYIRVVAASIDTFLSTRSNDEEVSLVLFTKLLEYEVDGDPRVINGSSIVAYIVFSDKLSSIDESDLNEEIKLDISPLEMEKAIDELLGMDEDERKMYAIHAKALFN
ncbi:hypothetical protein ACFL3C_00930 [Patescibacteria group bacterium]